MEQVFTNKEHGSTMMKSLSQLWKDGRYCDAVLEVGSQKLEFHKLILVACSPYVVGSRAAESDSGKLILKLNGEGLDIIAAKACLEYMYEGVVQVTENNVESVVGIARLLHLEDLVMYCSSFQELVKNMKKFKKSSSDNVSENEKTNKRFELVIDNENVGKSDLVMGAALKDTPDSTKGDQSVLEMSTEQPDSDSFDDSHSEFEQKVVTSNINDSVTESTFNHTDGEIKKITVKLEPDFDGSDAESDNEDNEMLADDADSDDSYTPQSKKKKKSPKGTKTKAGPKKIKKNIQETEQFTVVKNEEDNSFNEAEQEEMNIDHQTDKGEDKDFTAETLDDSIDLDGFIEPAEGKSKYKYLYKCPLCSRSRFIRKDTFLTHLKSHADPQLTCAVCPEKFNSTDELEIHKKSHLTHLCNQCGASFATIKRLNEHLSYVHLTGKYKIFTCKVEGCGRIFPRQSQLEGHMNIHEGLKPHVCTRCGRGFANMYSCRRHQSDCRMIRSVPCKKCGELFKTKATLREHKVTVHQNNKLFACKCGKKFSWRSGLARHRGKCGKEHVQQDPFDDMD